MNYLEKTDYTKITDAELAATVMAELEWHREQDAFVQGRYWSNGKGCAVGCLLKGDNHEEFPNAFGIPEILAHLDDRLFEGLPKADSVAWPEEFMGACIKVGQTREERMKRLGVVGWQFLYWLLTEELPKSVVGEGEIYDNVRKAIAQCADVFLPLITKGEKVDKAAAARAAARATHAAAAAADAVDAAYPAARAMHAAAYAADAVNAADAAAAAAAAADAAEHKRMAVKLIQLIQAA